MHNIARLTPRATLTDESLLTPIETLCDQGNFLQAQVLAMQLSQTEAAATKLIRYRTTNHLGASRDADAMLTWWWRKNPNDPAIFVEYIRSVLYRKGPYAAWKLFQSATIPHDINEDQMAELLSTKARMYARLRDFERAEIYTKQAQKLSPKNLWIDTEWSYICEIRDQYPLAIEVARQVLHTQADYRSGIQALAHFLTLAGKDDEALELLTQGLANSESASVASQLFDIQFENGQYHEAKMTLDTAERFSPLAEKRYKLWLASRRTDVALRLGDFETARDQMKDLESPFYRQILTRLDQAAPQTKRVLLPVGFVRQNHMTCAPATLTAISHYWKRSVDHLNVAEEICYDGTSNFSERQWAESQDYLAQEFTVDWDTSRALIDAGVPFSLATVHTGGAHLQAVIGYDDLRGTLLVRDPSERTYGEFYAKSLFESHQSSGPRGMLLLPNSETHRLADTTLPDAVLWDQYYAMAGKLQIHDRTGAIAIADQLSATSPNHRLATYAIRAIAMYDGDEPAILASTESLLKLYPDDVNLQLSKVSSLSMIGTRDQQLAWLQNTSAFQYEETQTLIRYASILLDDGRESANVAKILEKALARSPINSHAWFEVANLKWQQGEKTTAFECYRTASCLQDTSEHYASSYFRAGAFLKQSETALAYLHDRDARLGGKILPASHHFVLAIRNARSY